MGSQPRGHPVPRPEYVTAGACRVVRGDPDKRPGAGYLQPARKQPLQYGLRAVPGRRRARDPPERYGQRLRAKLRFRSEESRGGCARPGGWPHSHGRRGSRRLVECLGARTGPLRATALPQLDRVRLRHCGDRRGRRGALLEG